MAVQQLGGGLSFSPRKVLGFWGLLSSAWLLMGNEAIALSAWRFNRETYQLQFTTARAIVPDSFILKNPTRLVIDLPKTTLETDPVSKSYSGLISALRIAQFKPETTRIVLELSPEAKFASESVPIEKTVTVEGDRWQVTPKLEKIDFPLSQLMQIPAIESEIQQATRLIQVPPPPEPSLPSQPTPLSLAKGTQFRLQYRGKNPITLEVEEPWQEILFLEEKLTTTTGELIAPAETPVIGHFQTTPQGTRFITQALVTTLKPRTTSPPYPVVAIKGRSSLYPQSTTSPLKKVTIPPNTVFTIELTEAWHYQK